MTFLELILLMYDSNYKIPYHPPPPETVICIDACEDKRELFGRFEWTDDEGRKKHQERMSNGFRLFGKYFESLWD